MRNPLIKRLPRELKSEFGKYIVIFLLLIGSIGLISGFLVADGSMITAYNESFEKYNIEDGHFQTGKKLNKAQRAAIQGYGIRIYENYYVEKELTNGSTMRIYKNRDQVNKVCLMEGAFPENKNEIAIDRMYADNNKLSVGDTIGTKKHKWTVTGLVALSDYSALFSDNSDTMFDSIKFGVGVVTDEEFADYSSKDHNFVYAWKYDKSPADEKEEKDISEDLMKDIGREVRLKDFVPRYQNQAIRFTGDDMGGDRAMMLILLYIIIAIMAFVFGLTISDTIAKEANVIGTLRASGYTIAELVRHYMIMPVLVTLVAALIGNIMGYTFFKNFCAGMYYGSYSLPTYVTIWNGEAFILTTVVPVIMMLLINFFILRRKLSLSPLKFIRRDLSRKKQKRAFPLYRRIPFFTRFRLRVILQNMSNYMMLFVGIAFANLLLLFGIALPAVIDNYQQEISTNMLSKYQYMLTLPVSAVDEDRKLKTVLEMMLFQYGVETDNEDAEKFSAWSLKSIEHGIYKSEDILCYGIEEDSKYIHEDIPAGQVLVSATYADKYELKPGDTINLKEAYEDKSYDFKVAGLYDYKGALALFMNREELNRLFDEDDDYFSGYFSDSEITDIDDRYLGTVIDYDALTKVSRQLDRSMGDMMDLVNGFAVAIFLILIYLLSKIIIEKNAQSISMTKILGYSNREISGLYLASTTIMVILSLLVTIPLVKNALTVLFRYMIIQEMTGWIPLVIEPAVYEKMIIIGLVSYMVVALFEYRKIRKVPMDEALKNVE